MCVDRERVSRSSSRPGGVIQLAVSKYVWMFTIYSAGWELYYCAPKVSSTRERSYRRRDVERRTIAGGEKEWMRRQRWMRGNIDSLKAVEALLVARMLRNCLLFLFRSFSSTCSGCWRTWISPSPPHPFADDVVQDLYSQRLDWGGW